MNNLADRLEETPNLRCQGFSHASRILMLRPLHENVETS